MDGAHTFTGVGTSFKLDDLDGYAELTALYDQYKITGIKAQFFPRTNSLSQDVLVGTMTECPGLVTIVDIDDATAPADWTEICQYQGAKFHAFSKPFTLFFRPKVATAAYGAGAFTSYTSGTSPWIDAASPSVVYYGLKIGSFPYAIGNNTTIDPAWDIVYTFYVKCKGVR